MGSPQEPPEEPDEWLTDAPADNGEVDEVRRELKISIEDDPFGDCPPPVSSFEELQGVPQIVLQNLWHCGFKAPMPIQAQAMPLVVMGRDVIGLAQTGSGKTLAFLIPFAVSLGAAVSDWRKQSWITTSALVLAPTRELAVQISEEAQKIFNNSAVRVACVYGGGNKWTQQSHLKNGVHLLVGTPGRLIDFADSDVVELRFVSYFVLDEADRMLDMGFHDDVVGIANRTRAQRQTLFFSATWNETVQGLAQSLCSKNSQPVRISYAQEDCRSANGGNAKQQAREGIVQEVVVVDCPGSGGDRWAQQEAIKNEMLEEHIREVLQASDDNKILVFVSQKTLADKVSQKLQEDGFKADAMHGGKSQDYRLWVLDQFRRGELRLLVCTDVLGRGIDIPSVSHVVIHEMGGIEDYIHRIGRTARGRDGHGHALVFFEYWDGAPQLAGELAAVLESSNQHVPEDLLRIAAEVSAGQRPVKEWGWGKR